MSFSLSLSLLVSLSFFPPRTEKSSLSRVVVVVVVVALLLLLLAECKYVMWADFVAE